MKSKEQYKEEFRLVVNRSDDTVVEENILHDFAREVLLIDPFLQGGKVTVKEAKQRIKDVYKVWKNSLKHNNSKM